MSESDRRIRTTHIGSLPRTEAMLELLERRQSGESVDEGRWAATVTEATETAVRRQRDAGLDIINNGEQPRVSFNWYIENRLSGIEGEREAHMWADLAEFPEYAEQSFTTEVIDLTTQPAVTGAVEHTGTDALEEEIEAFEAALDDDVAAADTFLTAASPGVVAATHENEYYDSYEEYLFAVADAMATEYERIAETGATLQLDAPELLAIGHRNFVDQPLTEFKEAMATHVEAINEAVSSIPAEQIRLHTCWGSYEGPHHLDTDLVEMLPTLYEADISGLSVEQANPRHQHEYRAFAEQPLPDGWTLIPGVVDVKTNIIDHPETIADRIERVAEAMGEPSRLVAAPDCGFDTQAGLEMVDPEIAWAKLDALGEGAAVASDRLF